MSKNRLKPFDFSCKHNVMLQDADGTLRPMDEPYFQSEKIADGTWQIRSDGDFSYLVEGDNEAIMIDSGYGCGNIREYAQSLTDKPVRNILNTHCHFDHTANNGRFELAYMSAEAKPLATIPLPSFEGIYFPRDYPICVIGDGDKIDLGNRTLEAMKITDHTDGSLVFLDRSRRILFAGDEFFQEGKGIDTTVSHWAGCLEKMRVWENDYDVLYGGTGRADKAIVGKMEKACRRILDGEVGKPIPKGGPGPGLLPDPEGLGRIVYARFAPRPGDGPVHVEEPVKLEMDQDGYSLVYREDRIC